MHILFPFLLFLFSIYVLQRAGRKYSLFYLLLAAYLVRVGFSLFNVAGITFPMSDTTDIIRFKEFAEAIVESGFQFNPSQSYVWAAIIGIIDYYTGDDIYSPLFLNSLFGTLTVLFGYRISMLLYGERQRSLLVGGILAFLPSLIFTSASYLREATTILFLTMTVFYLLRLGLEREKAVSSAILLFLSCVVTAMFHGAFVFLAVFVLIYIVLKIKGVTLSARSVGSGLLMVIGLVILLSLLVYYEVGGGKVQGLYSFSVASIGESIMESISGAWMGPYRDLLITVPPAFFILSVLKFMFSPFFGETLRMYDLVRIPVSFFLFLSIGMIFIRSFAQSYKVRISFIYLFSILLLYIFLFSIGSNDPDTAFRHYIKFFPVIIAAGAPLGWIKYLQTRYQYPVNPEPTGVPK